MAMRIGGAGRDAAPAGASTLAPLQRDVGPAARPAADVEDRADRLGALLHVEQPEVAAPLRGRAGVRGDPGPGVVDRQRDAGLGRAVANDDRRLAVLDRVGERLLGDAEDRQLDVGRRPRPVGALEADLAAGQPLDPQDQPVERRPNAEVVEDRQAQVAADRAQPVGDRAARCSAPSVSPAVSRRRTSSVSSWSASSWMSAASRARSASVAATIRSRWSCARVARRASGRTVNRPAGDRDRPEPQRERRRCTGLVSVARANSGVAPATAYSVDCEEAAARRCRALRRPLGSSGPAAARPGTSGIAPIDTQRRLGPVPRGPFDGEDDAERDRTDGAAPPR